MASRYDAERGAARSPNVTSPSSRRKRTGARLSAVSESSTCRSATPPPSRVRSCSRTVRAARRLAHLAPLRAGQHRHHAGDAHRPRAGRRASRPDPVRPLGVATRGQRRVECARRHPRARPVRSQRQLPPVRANCRRPDDERRSAPVRGGHERLDQSPFGFGEISFIAQVIAAMLPPSGWGPHRGSRKASTPSRITLTSATQPFSVRALTRPCIAG
jgi:hypothetical protein